MLNFIKKYRKSPRRMVVTFSFQKKFVLNRLGDLMQKNDKKMIEEYKEIELSKMECEPVCSDVGYVLEGANAVCYDGKNNPLKEKKKQIEAEQAQILERDCCKRAFKENYHIKPLNFGENAQRSNCQRVLASEKDMRGGIVCEKSYKILLCDLATVGGAALLLATALIKAKVMRK